MQDAIDSAIDLLADDAPKSIVKLVIRETIEQRGLTAVNDALTDVAIEALKSAELPVGERVAMRYVKRAVKNIVLDLQKWANK